MNTRDIYEIAGEDFEPVKRRLASEEFIGLIVEKFAEDGTFSALAAALKKQDVSSAFRAAHTLKGVASNLGFSALAASASFLTEILRVGSFIGADEAFIKVKAAYDKVIGAINAAKNKCN